MAYTVKLVNMIMTLIWLLGYAVTLVQSQGCSQLLISGILNTDHYSLSGVYHLSIGDTCSARVVYKQSGGNGYLFYRSGNWIIGDRLCVDSGSLKASDSVDRPEDITRGWEESNAGWQDSPGVKASCYQGFTGCRDVLISGILTAAQYELTGIYRNSTNQTCTGHPVYSQRGGTFYLFYMFGHWVLAYDACVTSVVYKALDNSQYPEDIHAKWELSVGSGWMPATDMTATCYAGFTGCTQVELSGVQPAEYQVLNAVYRKHRGYTCTGRSVYVTRMDVFVYYIYYNNGHWIVGDKLCAESGTLKVRDTALYIELVTHIWEVSIESGWQYGEVMQVACYEGFAGCPEIQVSGEQYTDLFSPVLSYGGYRLAENVTCSDRPVYGQLGGGYYVYYKDDRWRIGTDACADDSVLMVEEDVVYPEDLTVTWLERNGLVWIPRISVVVACFRRSTGCDLLKLTGTRYHNDTVGIYKASDDYCNGRSVYQSLGGALYLYYMARYWVIGVESCNSSFMIRVVSVTQQPEVSNATWEEKQEDGWSLNSDVSTACYIGFKGCEQLSLHQTVTSSVLEGSYTADLDMPCNGRYTYIHTSGKYFLYTSQGFWVIGKSRCSSSEWRMRADVGSMYPDDIRRRWYETIDDAPIWSSSSVARLMCTGRHSMRLTGTRLRHSAVGTYDVTSMTCNDRSVLRQRGGAFYLFFLDGRLFSSVWSIGPTVCKNTGVVISVVTEALYPENITGSWREREQDTWVDNNHIELDIDSGFQGCPELTVIYSSDVINKYSVMDVTSLCSGRRVYRHSSGRYLYASGDYWMIGGVMCSPEGGVGARVPDGAMYPEYIKATWQLPFVDDATILVQCRKACEELEMITEGVDPPSNGYILISDNSSCSGRSSYIHSTTDMYLFYLAHGADNFRGWVIGPVLCLDHGALRVWDPASYPEDILHTWTRLNDTVWQHTDAIQFVCKDQPDELTTNTVDFTTAEPTATPLPVDGGHNDRTMITIAGIVIGGLVLLLIIIAILVLCLRKTRNKTPQNPTQVHTNPLANTNDENENGHTVRMSEIAMADMTSDTIPKPDRSKQYSILK